MPISTLMPMALATTTITPRRVAGNSTAYSCAEKEQCQSRHLGKLPSLTDDVNNNTCLLLENVYVTFMEHDASQTKSFVFFSKNQLI